MTAAPTPYADFVRQWRDPARVVDTDATPDDIAHALLTSAPRTMTPTDCRAWLAEVLHQAQIETAQQIIALADDPAPADDADEVPARDLWAIC